MNNNQRGGGKGRTEFSAPRTKNKRFLAMFAPLPLPLTP